MDKSLLINKILSNSKEFINHRANCEFTATPESWNLSNLKYWQQCVIEKIQSPINNIDDKITWKFATYGESSVKIANVSTMTVKPYLAAKFINSIWKLN